MECVKEPDSADLLVLPIQGMKLLANKEFEDANLAIFDAHESGWPGQFFRRKVSERLCHAFLEMSSPRSHSENFC